MKKGNRLNYGFAVVRFFLGGASNQLESGIGCKQPVVTSRGFGTGVSLPYMEGLSCYTSVYGGVIVVFASLLFVGVDARMPLAVVVHLHVGRCLFCPLN